MHRSQRAQTVDMVAGDGGKVGTAQSDTCDEAFAHTISFEIEAPTDGSQWIRVAEALVSAFLDGNSYTRRVSVIDGQSLTMVGNKVSVRVEDKSRTTPAVPGAPKEPYNVGIFIGPGTRGGSAQPPTLIPAIDPATLILAPGGSVVIPIPVDAGVTSLAVTVFDQAFGVIAENKVEVQQNLGALEVLRQYDPRDSGSLWVPLGSGVTSIKLMNHTAGQTIAFSITFGIDG